MRTVPVPHLAAGARNHRDLASRRHRIQSRVCARKDGAVRTDCERANAPKRGQRDRGHARIEARGPISTATRLLELQLLGFPPPLQRRGSPRGGEPRRKCRLHRRGKGHVTRGLARRLSICSAAPAVIVPCVCVQRPALAGQLHTMSSRPRDLDTCTDAARCPRDPDQIPKEVPKGVNVEIKKKRPISGHFF
jgi:hypothetical protein